MTPMSPPPAMPAQQPAQPNAPFPSQEDLVEIENDTGYTRERILRDVQRTGATDKESLYPQVYSGSGIQPDAAATGAGYGDDESAQQPVPGNEPAEGEPPQRVAARAAMAGQEMNEAPVDEAAEPPQQQATEQQMGEEPDPAVLGVGAAMRKPSNIHERARRMKVRPY